MNKRNRTNVYIKDGLGFLADLIKRTYSTGTVGVVYEKKLETISQAIMKVLSANGSKCKSLTFEQAQQHNLFEDHVRFVIGVGDRKLVNIVQKNIGQKRYGFYCTEVCADYFTDGMLLGMSSTFAEFAYFDTLKYGIKDPKVAKSIYITLLSLLSALIDLCCYNVVLPYKDLSAERFLKKTKDLLLSSTDKEVYLYDTIKHIKEVVDYLNKQHTLPVVFKIRKQKFENWNYKEEFLTNYLLFYMAIVFTKLSINDMLIPSSVAVSYNQIIIDLLLKKRGKIAGYALTRDEVNHISLVFRAMGEDLADIDVLESIRLIIQNCKDAEGFFKEINNIGVIENLINYEDNERY